MLSLNEVLTIQLFILRRAVGPRSSLDRALSVTAAQLAKGARWERGSCQANEKKHRLKLAAWLQHKYGLSARYLAKEPHLPIGLSVHVLGRQRSTIQLIA